MSFAAMEAADRSALVKVRLLPAQDALGGKVNDHDNFVC